MGGIFVSVDWSGWNLVVCCSVIVSYPNPIHDPIHFWKTELQPFCEKPLLVLVPADQSTLLIVLNRWLSSVKIVNRFSIVSKRSSVLRGIFYCPNQRFSALCRLRSRGSNSIAALSAQTDYPQNRQNCGKKRGFYPVMVILLRRFTINSTVFLRYFIRTFTKLLRGKSRMKVLTSWFSISTTIVKLRSLEDLFAVKVRCEKFTSETITEPQKQNYHVITWRLPVWLCDAVVLIASLSCKSARNIIVLSLHLLETKYYFIL